MNSEGIKDAKAALNATSSQFEAAATGALLSRPRHELNPVARWLGIENPDDLTKPQLVEAIKAELTKPDKRRL